MNNKKKKLEVTPKEFKKYSLNFVNNFKLTIVNFLICLAFLCVFVFRGVVKLIKYIEKITKKQNQTKNKKKNKNYKNNLIYNDFLY